MRKPQAKTRPSGLRALEASGDGFWELNLLDGSAWFSDWFVAQLGWDPEAKPATWAALRKVLTPQGWERVLTDMRAHLERRVPFDVEVAVVAAPGAPRWWRLRGEAERNEAGQAHYFSGGVQDVSAAHEAAAAERRENDLLGKGFEALPTAAAFIDSTGMVLRSNDAWRDTRANADSDYFASLSEDADTGGRAQRPPNSLRDYARYSAARAANSRRRTRSSRPIGAACCACARGPSKSRACAGSPWSTKKLK